MQQGQNLNFSSQSCYIKLNERSGGKTKVSQIIVSGIRAQSPDSPGIVGS